MRLQTLIFAQLASFQHQTATISKDYSWHHEIVFVSLIPCLETNNHIFKHSICCFYALCLFWPNILSNGTLKIYREGNWLWVTGDHDDDVCWSVATLQWFVTVPRTIKIYNSWSCSQQKCQPNDFLRFPWNNHFESYISVIFRVNNESEWSDVGRQVE